MNNKIYEPSVTRCQVQEEQDKLVFMYMKHKINTSSDT